MSKIDRIMIATDFSDHSRSAMKQAALLAQQLEAELLVCHIMEPLPLLSDVPSLSGSPDRSSDLRALAEKWLKDFGVQRGWVLVERGHAFVEIVRIARNEEIDLIVVGSHGRGPIAHMLLGSVAERVVRKAPCSVLVVREDGHDFEFP